MEIKQLDGGVTLIAVEGSIVLGRESQRLEWKVDELLKQNSVKLILDLSKAHYLDSAGLGILAGATGQARQAGGELVLVAPNERVTKLFEMTGTNKIFAIEADVPGAVERLGKM